MTENSEHELQGQFGVLHDGGAVGLREEKKPWIVMVVYEGSEKPSGIIPPRNSDHKR